MPELRCTKGLKLTDVDKRAVAINDDPLNGFAIGTFWLEGEAYEMTEREAAVLLKAYPDHFSAPERR